MKREFLEGLNLEAEAIDKIMAENGKDINAAKSKFADYDDLKSQLEKANAAIEKFSDYDSVKADVEKYRAEAAAAKKDAEARVAALERQAKIKDFTGTKKFVNEMTRGFINAEMERLLLSDESKGKSLDDLLREITDGKENVFAEDGKPTPPVVTHMGGSVDRDKEDDNFVRRVMGLPPKE